MDEDLILNEIVKSLAFEIEAVNKDNVIKWSTTNGTPLNVKVRVRNKDEPRLVQRGTMPVPRIAISAPEKLALVSSNQTILSFSVFLQDEYEKKDEHKRHSAFKIFNIGSCLGTYNDDEGPYLPSSSNQDADRSDSSISSSGILKKKVSQVLSTSNAVPQNKKRFFGKCKPGGCLDPPFGEDEYSYDLSKTDQQENLQLELNKLEDSKKTFIPGGCLDSSLSEEKYPYSLPKTDYHKKLGVKLDETTDDTTESQKKLPESSREHETFVQKTTKDEDDPKKLTDIERTSEENSLKLKYSNSIITYPTDKRSKEKVHDQISKRKMSIKSNDDDSLRQSYDYPESYFVPPKDVIRYKDEERRHVRRLSTDQLSRSSKVASNDMADKSSFFKTISKESKNISQYTKGSKDSLHEKKKQIELQPNDIDLSSKLSVNKHETVTLAQLSPGFKDISSYVDTNSKYVDTLKTSESSHIEYEIKNHRLQQEIIPTTDIRKSNKNINGNQDDKNIAEMQVKQDIPSFRSTSRETINKISGKASNENRYENLKDDIEVVEFLVKQEMPSIQHTSKEAMISLSPKKTNKDETKNFVNSTTTAEMQVKGDKASTRGTSRVTMGKLSYSNVPYSSRTRILEDQNTQKQEHVEVDKISTPVLKRFVNTDIQTPTNLNQKFKNNDGKNDDKIIHYKKTEITEAIIPIVATAAAEIVTEKQSLLSKNKLDVMTDGQGHPQGRNLSPNYISSTENFEFDLSSSHSMDFKQELLSTGKRNELMDTSNKEDKWLSAASNNIKGKNGLRDNNLNSELDEKKASAILQKKPFVTKQDSDIYNDDINKATPLKRNTFTIIGSDTSLQKSEEIEELPENITDVHLKTTDKTKSVSPEKTHSIIDISDNINRKQEHKIHTDSAIGTTQKIKRDYLEDMYSNITVNTKAISDEQATRRKESLDKSTRPSGNVLTTDFDKSLKPKNLSDPTYKQKEILDTTTNNRIHTTLQEQLPVDAKDKRSNISENDEATTTVQSALKTELLDTKDQTTLVPTEKKELTKTAVYRKSVLDGPMNDKIELSREYEDLASLQKSIPEHEQKAYPTVYYDTTAYSTKNNDMLVDNENTSYSNTIIETLQKPTTKKENDLFSEMTDDSNKVLIRPSSDEIDRLDTNVQKNTISDISSTQKLKLESARNLEPVMTDIVHDKSEISKYRTSTSGSLLKMGLENVQDLHAQFADDNKNVSDQINDTGTFLDSENIKPTKEFIPKHVQDLHPEDPIRDKTEEKNIIYNELDKLNYTDLDDSLKMKLDNVQYFNAPTAYDIGYVSSDRTYDTRASLDSQSVESAQRFIPEPENEHVRDLHSAMTDKNQDKNEIDNLKYSKSAKDDLLQMKSENLQGMHAETAYDNEYVSSDQINDTRAFIDSESIEQTQTFIPGYGQDFHAAMTEKSHDNTVLNDQIYSDFDKVIYNESTTDNLQYHAIAPDIDHISSDQKYDKRALLVSHSNEPQVEIYNVDHDIFSRKYHEQIELNQNLADNIKEFKEKSRSGSMNNSPFSGYSGLISEVLSNISETTEDEEKHSAAKKVAEGSSLGNFATHDTQAYRDHETLDNEFANIVEEPVFKKLTRPSDYIDSSYKIDDGSSLDVPQNSLAKSFTSTLEESDRMMHKETIAKTFETIPLAHSSNKLRRSDDYLNDTLNIVRDEVLLDHANDITKQNSEYQSSKILNSTNGSIGLNEAGFPFTHNEKPNLVKQKEIKTIETQSQLQSTVNESKLDRTETTYLEKDPIYLDMSFYSYMNDNKQRVVQTHSPMIEQHRPHDGTVTVVKTLIRHGNEMRIPVDKENDISLNILDKDVTISTKGGSIGSPLRHNRREKHVTDRGKRHNDVINRNLALIYEHELLPLHNVIKDLAEEVNTLSAQQEKLLKSRNAKRTKSLRLIPVVKRCGCRRC